MSATILIGAAVGAVVGGLGGRLAMRILFLTSDDTVKGVVSDDGFEIGRFTLASTLGLVLVTAILGVLAALLYLVVRPFVVPLGRWELPAMAAFYGVVGAAMMVHRDGVDFTVLEPALLAIALFTAICAGFGAAAGALLRRADGRAAWPQRWGWPRIGPPLVALAFPPFLIAAAAGVVVRQWAPVLRPAAVVVMAGLFLLAAIDLTRDVVALA